MILDLEKEEQFAGDDRHKAPLSSEVGQIAMAASMHGLAAGDQAPDLSKIVSVKEAGIPAKLLSEISTHVSVMKNSGVGELSVLIQPEPSMRLWLHLKQEGGRIEITARCESGDLQKLSSHWNELQRSLGSQGIGLATLSEGDANGAFNNNAGGQGRDGAAGRPLWDAWWENPFPGQRESKSGIREAVLLHAGAGEGWQSWA